MCDTILCDRDVRPDQYQVQTPAGQQTAQLQQAWPVPSFFVSAYSRSKNSDFQGSQLAPNGP